MENETYIVYMHRCPNDNKYIGVTRVKTYSRFHGGSGYRYNKEFYSDIKKYGWRNIEHIIISENIDKEQAYKLEQELIKKYNTTNFKNGYNKQNGGEKNKNTDEIKQKIRNARLGTKLKETTKQKLRKQKIGKKADPLRRDSSRRSRIPRHMGRYALRRLRPGQSDNYIRGTAHYPICHHRRALQLLRQNLDRHRGQGGQGAEHRISEQGRGNVQRHVYQGERGSRYPPRFGQDHNPYRPRVRCKPLPEV